jgi:hypothetical protein
MSHEAAMFARKETWNERIYAIASHYYPV